MRIIGLPDQSHHVVGPGVLIKFASMAFTRDLETAFTTLPFRPQSTLVPEEQTGVIKRVGEGEDISFEMNGRPRIMAHVPGPVLALNLLFPFNYFHFMIECLPSVYALMREGVLEPETMLVSGLLHPNMALALSFLMRERRMSIIQLRAGGDAVLSEQVILPRSSFYSAERLDGGITPPYCNAENIAALREGLRPTWSDPRQHPPLKLLIRRKRDGRSIVNFDEVERRAVAAGYTVMAPEDYSLNQQVRMFSTASHIIGPTGAWLSNLLFVRRRTRVAVFYPETCREGPIWNLLGRACGVEVEEIFCPIAKYDELQPIHSDYFVPPEILNPLLKD